MRSEALRNIRTMRHVKGGIGVATKVRTTNSLSKTREEIEHLKSLTDRQQEQILEKERRRFAAQELALRKSRQRVLQSREKLARMINRNRALNELRQKLQRARWDEDDPVSSKGERTNPEGEMRQIELRY